ncbi:cell filamentation protein Fic [Roseivirga seohaensis]|uniref:Cell filamentation protein Fic n=1 Tax=Roseivirga seohaensis TaxID=1914963 RepID=A0A150Y260_9BACT|nr:Fic/DOC family N-terminal domain-containing protein [Roseivirga seohaensis]KYG84925.1 cell filamentation protein Fic [Roseivirga seohaensis]
MKPYQPEELPLKTIEWGQFIDLMGKANRYVARYDGLLQSVINPDVLLAPLRTQEAVLSSKIEGTQATLEEVLEFEADEKASDHLKGDIWEVINYRVALKQGRDSMKERPLSLNSIKRMHEALMQGVRGDSKDPGNFRRIQNYIGSPGSNIENARFVPPSIPVMLEALYNWEKYIHVDDKDVLVQLAIIHAQFEIIHPFLDGNGRMGRILIPLFLYHKEIIQEPVFYLSDYLESNRSDYYDALKEITDSGSWTNWIRFFLNAIIVQAEKNIRKTREIISLYETVKLEIANSTHSQFSIQCLDSLFVQPIFSSRNFEKNSQIPRSSVARLLNTLVENKVLDIAQKGAGRRPTIYAFRRLLNIVNN